MSSKAMIKAEFINGIRNYRFLIVFVSFLFFAVLTPVLTKLVLPGVLSSAYPDMSSELLEAMFSMTQAESVRSYLGDIFQIGTLVVAFVFSGIIAQELSEKTLILPVCTGKRYAEIVLAKIIVNGPVLILATTAAVLANYYYSGLMFGFTMGSIAPALRAGLLQGLYMVFVLSMLMLIGVFIKKNITTGLLTLIPAFGIGLLGNLLRVERFLPSGLMVEAQLLAYYPSTAMLQSVISSLAVIAIAVACTVLRLGNMELSQG